VRAGDRDGLWEEKVGLREPFGGNVATQWGTLSEARALEAYHHVTGEPFLLPIIIILLHPISSVPSPHLLSFPASL
jgi:hypothetical protein